MNGNAAKYADQCQGDACNDPASKKMLGGYYADWTAYNGHGGYKLLGIKWPSSGSYAATS